jgi:hypothetical protein
MIKQLAGSEIRVQKSNQIRVEIRPLWAESVSVIGYIGLFKFDNRGSERQWVPRKKRVAPGQSGAIVVYSPIWLTYGPTFYIEKVG